jgi:hypothetical protein
MDMLISALTFVLYALGAYIALVALVALIFLGLALYGGGPGGIPRLPHEHGAVV